MKMNKKVKKSELEDLFGPTKIGDYCKIYFFN